MVLKRTIVRGLIGQEPVFYHVLCLLGGNDNYYREKMRFFKMINFVFQEVLGK